MEIDVGRAAAELMTKTLSMLQAETAYVWASRAGAAYRFYRDTNQARWLLDAEEYRHEALEHAALTEDKTVYPIVRRALDNFRNGYV